MSSDNTKDGKNKDLLGLSGAIPAHVPTAAACFAAILLLLQLII